jgi:hypothetical protein
MVNQVIDANPCPIWRINDIDVLRPTRLAIGSTDWPDSVSCGFLGPSAPASRFTPSDDYLAPPAAAMTLMVSVYPGNLAWRQRVKRFRAKPGTRRQIHQRSCLGGKP